MKKLTTPEFIEKSKSIHGSKYDYSKVNYINTNTKVEIICKKHGSFHQKPNHHLSNHGCPRCSFEKNTLNRIISIEEFISRASVIHSNKYDYSNSKIRNNKVNIKCLVHDVFYQTPDSHLRNHGCPKCSNLNRSIKNRSTKKIFMSKANRKHNSKYDYSKVNYINTNTKVEIICKKHGSFHQTPHNHLKGTKCPKCSSRYKLVYGVGINDADYVIETTINNKQVRCPFYEKWVGVLRRCYSDKFQKNNTTYIGTTVCKEWLTFSNFKKWMETQDWQGKDLDKDILTYGTGIKLYSPETCMFVTSGINSLLTNSKANRGKYPQGVSMYRKTGSFVTKLSKYGISKHIGFFKTPSTAHKVYIKEKVNHITEIALKQEDRLKDALLNVALLISLRN